MQLSNRLFFAQVEEVLASGSEVQLRVKGSSMRPLLRNERDVVVLAPRRPGQPLRCGEIVLFRYRGRHILHRIVRIDGERLTLAGDGNYRQKERIRPGDITAYVDSIERNGRHIDYGSVRWHLLTAWSLAVKSARTLYHDLRGTGRRSGTPAA